ncbi:MAG: hypothetical protein QM723_38035 [Myxococcaceae bacterium]
MTARTGVLIAALACAACGKGIDGTWRLTSMVSLQGGGTSTIANDFVILPPPMAWKAGGACEAPLTQKGDTAFLTNLNWTCPLQSQSGLPFPFDGQGSYQWKSGDVLLVKNAQFTLGTDDQLAVVISLQIRTDPNDPSFGDTLDLTTQPGHGAIRLK